MAYAVVAWLLIQSASAMMEGKRTLQLDPNLANIYREEGLFSETSASFLKAQQIAGQPQPGLAISYAIVGRQAEARQILAELNQIAAKYFAAEEIASVYPSLGCFIPTRVSQLS